MPSFLARIKGTPWSTGRSKQSRAASESAASHNTGTLYRPIDHKIHPDLNSLLEQEHGNDGELNDPFKAPKMTHIQPTQGLEFISLTTSTRRRQNQPSIHLKASSSETDNVENATKRTQALDQSMSSSSTSSSTGRNLSGDTFGQRYTSQPRLGNQTALSKAPTTPGSEASHPSDNDTRSSSQRTTPGSSSDISQSGRSRRNTVSSRNTFGIPSPAYTPAPRRKHHAFSEEQPPMPPLDHPAFQCISKNGDASLDRGFPLTLQDDFIAPSKVTRHSHSLPSLSRRSRAVYRATRTRARTESNDKPFEFFSGATSSTPITYRQMHKRTESDASQSSSRRASAEFSAKQASFVSHGDDVGASWEAQVSREMVRISLGEKQAKPGTQAFAEPVMSKSGQARGNRSAGPPLLGSPFLLQHAHTHYIPPATHCSIISTPYSINSAISSRNFRIQAMPKPSQLSPAAKSTTPERSRTPSPRPKIKTASYATPGAPSTSHLAPPSLSFTAATPEPSPITPFAHSTSSPEPLSSVLRVPKTPPTTNQSNLRGKRKADEAGVDSTTPPKEAKEPRATFAVEPRPHRVSANSNSTRSAPSSYHRKRARLSTTPESRPGSADGANAANTGSWSSKRSVSSSHHGHRAPQPTYQPPHRAPSRRSLSQASIPISALISPHAPSISRSSTFHMRDPRKPAPIQTTVWSLSLPTGPMEPGEGWRSWAERGGSPLHAWVFFAGFVFFPLWWVASFTGIPKTRRLGGEEQEKGVVLDDPQVEFDAKSWRLRCRIMAVISLFTYIPFIVCVAIFA